MRRAGGCGASKKGKGTSRCRCREVHVGMSPAGSGDHTGVEGGVPAGIVGAEIFFSQVELQSQIVGPQGSLGLVGAAGSGEL